MAATSQTVSLPGACALALGCLAALLVPPDGALGKEVQLQQSPEPRVARWFTNINKYMEKLFNNRSKKPPKHKKPSNSTNSTPSSVTVHPHLNITNSTTVKHQLTPSTGRTTGGSSSEPPPITPEAWRGSGYPQTPLDGEMDLCSSQPTQHGQ